jgi:ATP-binding cassette subfamily C protein PrsD
MPWLPSITLLDRHPPLASAIAILRVEGWLILGLSAVLNVLALAGAIYMMLVYDSVLPSGSGATLAALTTLIILLYVGHGWFDMVRQRLLHRIAATVDDTIADHFLSLGQHAAAQGGLAIDGEPMQEWDQLRKFLTSSAPLAILDIPWVMLFLILLALLHPLLGLTTTVGAVLLTVYALYCERRIDRQSTAVVQAARNKGQTAYLANRHAALLRALGSSRAFRSRLHISHSAFVVRQVEQAETQALHQASGRAARLFMQSLVLAVGALLVIEGEASGGIIFASAILAGRALAPIDQLVGHWSVTVTARNSWHALQKFLEHYQLPEDPAVRFDRPDGALGIETVEIVAASGLAPLFPSFSASIPAGSLVAIIGASGAGKSSLLRALAGITPIAGGTLRLGQVAYNQWSAEDFGKLIGYLPPTVDLIAGSVADNISRYNPEVRSEDVISAARQAAVHNAILELPEGYETCLSDSGRNLPGGIAQRIGLARAMFGNPPLLLLDEPTSNLDQGSINSLLQSLRKYADKGNTILVATHHPLVISQSSQITFLSQGAKPIFGPRGQVLQQLSVSGRTATHPVNLQRRQR